MSLHYLYIVKLSYEYTIIPSFPDIIINEVETLFRGKQQCSYKNAIKHVPRLMWYEGLQCRSQLVAQTETEIIYSLFRNSVPQANITSDEDFIILKTSSGL